MKPQPPDVVISWRKRMREPIPRCCHTCDHYQEDGMCRIFNEYPPEEFAASLGACASWEDEIPF